MKNILIAVISFLFISNIGHTQSYSRWADLLSYNDVSDLELWKDKVVAIGEYGVFFYDLEDESLSKLSKVNGLIGEKISTAISLKNSNAIVVGYETGDFDIVYEDSRIIHVNNIKNSSVSGSKRINCIEEYEDRIFLGTPFGIVAYDIDKEEFGDTYFFGDNGSYVHVNDIAFSGQNIFAATNDGVYKADVENPFLVDYRRWEKQVAIPQGKYTSIVEIGGNILTNYKEKSAVQYVFKGDNWSIQSTIGNIIKLKSTQGFVSYTASNKVTVYNSDLSKVDEVVSHDTKEFSFTSALYSNDVIWASSSKSGLVDTRNTELKSILPIGPSKNNSFRLKTTSDRLYLLYGYYSPSYAPRGYRSSYDIFENGDWTVVESEEFRNKRDLVNVSVDPNDEKHIYISSWGDGVVEMYEDELVETWNDKNSTLQKLYYEPNPDYTSIRIGGGTFDNDGNIWFANGWSVEKPFVMRSADGEWYSFAVNKELGYGDDGMAGVVIDDNGNKWIGTRHSGIWIFNEGDYFKSSGDFMIMKFNIGENRGNLPDVRVNSIAIDKNNIAWIGTQKGLVIFNDLDKMYDLYRSNRLNARPVIIEEGGVGKKLLGDQKINKIVVDGSNKKWFATESGGVYYTSSDGQKTIYHFTIDNSPLLSNTILDLDVDPKTGIVYIVTTRGLVSFKGNATEGGSKFAKVFAYPNPVRPNYSGDIYIKGLTDKTNIKITDINGNLIFETTSEGGQAVWNGNSLSGYKAASGVYLVFAISKDGNEKAITKILIVN